MKTMREETIKKIIIISSIVIFAITIFAISYIVTSNSYKRENLAEKKDEVESQTASSSMGKNVEESEKNNSNNVVDENESAKVEEDIKKDENTVNRQIETSKVEANNETKQVNKQIQKKSEKDTQNSEQEKESIVENEEERENESKKTLCFVAPVEGEILKDFSMDSLVYSETLKEWTTHSGIDIRAEKSTVVKATADGIVKSIKNDPRYGLTVVIQHDENYQSVYSNLLTTEFVKEGEEVKQGQSIGTVGSTASFEIADPSHLHFEILKDGVAINPGLYL